MRSKKETLIVSAFCGAGKTHLCSNSNGRMVEFECWMYFDKPDFPNNIVKDVLAQYGKVDVIFISTNPHVLNCLLDKDMKVIVVCPNISLKSEYIARYKSRGSSSDFIHTLSKYWDQWVLEAKAHRGCRHFVLESGQYLESILLELEHSHNKQFEAMKTNAEFMSEGDRLCIG